MIQRLFLFPNSRYLREQWWHRLATVIFWAWFATVVGLAYQGLIAKPYDYCIRHETACGSSRLQYAFHTSMADPNFWLAVAVLALAPFLAVIVYRIALYVAKGSTWRDPYRPSRV